MTPLKTSRMYHIHQS